MATPTITETLELPGGTLTTAAARAIKVRLRLVAADSGEAVGYATGDDVTVGGTRWTTLNTSGVYSFSTVRPNSGSSGDQISSPTGTVYELVVRFPDRPAVTRYIDVPDTAGPHQVQDILTAAPSGMLSPLLDGTTGIAVTFETDGAIADVLDGWTDGASNSAAFDDLEVLAGRVVVPTPDTGAIGGSNPAAHGVAWRDWSHLGSWTGTRFACGGWWTGETPMEATPLVHVVEASDEYGIGVWPAGDILPGTPGDQPALLWGYVGIDNTEFTIVATLAFTELPDNIDLADGRRHHFEIRSWDGEWSFWVDGSILTPKVNGTPVGPWLTIPTALLGSTVHGLAVDNNQLDGNGGNGGARTANVGAWEGPWTLAPLVDAERSPAVAAGVAGSLAYKADQADVDTVTSGLAAHLADTSDAHDASAISYAGGTGMSATDVEAAIDELATEKADVSGETFSGDVIVQVTGATGKVQVGNVGGNNVNSLAVYGDSAHTQPISAVGSLLGAGGVLAGPGGATTVDTYLIRSAEGVWTAGGGGVTGLGKGLTLTEQSAPSSPAANDITLYAADNAGTTVLRTKDSAGTVTTLGAGGGGLTAEDVRDTIGTALVAGEGIDITVNDGADTITVDAELASDANPGAVELATSAETTTGTDTARAVTPDGLAGSEYGVEVVQILVTDPSGSALTTGDGKAYFMVPSKLNGWNLIRANAAVTTVSSSGTPTVQVHNVTDAVDMLSTRITIDANESTSHTAATPPVIDTTKDDVATGDLIRVDVDVAGTGAKGLIVSLSFQAP